MMIMVGGGGVEYVVIGGRHWRVGCRETEGARRTGRVSSWVDGLPCRWMSSQPPASLPVVKYNSTARQPWESGKEEKEVAGRL